MSIYEPSTSLAETQSIGDTPNSLTRRKRILRTYGRRSREQQEQEPFAKKRKVKQDDDVPATLNTDRQSIQRPSAPPSNPIEEAELIKKSTKRGSILAYFKPRRIALSSDPPSISDGFPSSDPVERPPSPPRRTRRRLTTKPTTQVVTSVDEKEEKDSSTIILKGVETALNEVPLNTAYAQSEDRRPLVKNAEEKKKRSPKQSKELVQTVLSLSINKEPGFVICKECGILYNPLNGEDRKEHRKRHGAWVRAKGKAEEQGEAEVETGTFW